MAALWVPCMYMCSDMETSCWLGFQSLLPGTGTAWMKSNPTVGAPKVSIDGFYLETLNPQVHGRRVLSTFDQGRESSFGAWLGRDHASKEVMPWVGGKNGSWEIRLHSAAESSAGDFQQDA